MIFTRQRTILLLLLPLLLAATAANAQWELVERSASLNISDIFFLEDGLHGWTAGTASTMRILFKTLDGGESWDEFDLPGPVSSLYFASPDSGWGVNSYGKIYRTLNGGETWTQQTSGTTRELSDITFINHLEGWACGGWGDGNSYLVLHTTNGGDTWEDQSFGHTGYSCNTIHFTDSLHGWVGGYSSTLYAQVHATDDGGVTWTEQTLPTEVLDSGIDDIDFADSLEGWAVISSIYVPGCILHTTDGGDSWSIQYTTDLHYHTLDVRDADHVAVVGVAILSPSTTRVYTTSNGGDTWSYSTPPVHDYISGPQYVGNSIWIAKDESMILRSPDNGVTWEWQHRAPYWRTIDWIDEFTGRVGSGSSAGTDSYGIISTDGGTAWVHDSLAPGGTQYLFLDSDIGWMLWEGVPATLWRTIDGGDNWTQHGFGISSWIGAISFATADSGWACGSGGTMRTTVNGGISWTPQNLQTSMYVADVQFIDSKEGWAVGGYGGGNGFIRHTVDGGLTWLAQAPVTSAHIQHLFFLDDQYGWAIGLGGTVQRTTDGGDNWVATAGIPYHPDAIIMISPTVGWLTGSQDYENGGRGFIYGTDNGGMSWDLEWTASWPQQGISDFALQGDSILWACGFHSTILKRDITTGIEEGTPAIPGSMISITPNPFRGSATVSVGLNPGGPVRLDVFDLSGRLVVTLTEGYAVSGQHDFVLDAESLLPGVYLLQLNAGDRVTTRRCILLR